MASTTRAIKLARTIVCTPEEAYLCFMRTNIDILVLGHFIFKKKDQPNFSFQPD